MQNTPGVGPTRADKTSERMAQERQSPGATSAGGHGADAPDNDTSLASESFKPAGPEATSANTDARRGDAAAAAEAIDAAQNASREAPDAIDDDVPSVAPRSRDARIREAAYRISQSRDQSGGDEVTDWLQAEAEVDAAERDAGTPRQDQACSARPPGRSSPR